MSLATFPQPDNGLETGKKVFDFLDRTGLLQIRKSDARFNEWFQELSYEDSIPYLTRLNGIVREVSVKERAVDGSNVRVVFGDDICYLPPAAEQKDGLLRETFDALKQIPDNDDRALLAYYAIQAIHPYSEGNGRTGRLLYEMISDGGKSLTRERLSKLLDHNEKGRLGIGEGRKTFAREILSAPTADYYVNREVVRDVLGEDYLKKYGGIHIVSGTEASRLLQDPAKKGLSVDEVVLAEQILGEGDDFKFRKFNELLDDIVAAEDHFQRNYAKYGKYKDELSAKVQAIVSEGARDTLSESYVNNFPFRGIVLSQLLREKASLQACQYEEKDLLDVSESIVPEDVDKKILGIDVAKLMPNLSVADVHRLISIHREVKEKFIRTLVDIFVHPDKHQINTKDGTSVPIKSIFRLSQEA